MRVIGVFGCPVRPSQRHRQRSGGERKRRKLPFNLVLSNKEMCDTI